LSKSSWGPFLSSVSNALGSRSLSFYRGLAVASWFVPDMNNACDQVQYKTHCHVLLTSTKTLKLIVNKVSMFLLKSHSFDQKSSFLFKPYSFGPLWSLCGCFNDNECVLMTTSIPVTSVGLIRGVCFPSRRRSFPSRTRKKEREEVFCFLRVSRTLQKDNRVSQTHSASRETCRVTGRVCPGNTTATRAQRLASYIYIFTF